MPVIEVIGTASGRSTLLTAQACELGETLLDWLRKKGITIASSCDGEGVCKKCSIQDGWLTCELTLEQLFQRSPDGKIYVSYL
ncbi:MAG TPA: hypothetical protein VNJ01_02375 [Bacteriovoracaceae bacterium]|nr:hypothetical protein [Bacteriovoracaceae bacterium]